MRISEYRKQNLNQLNVCNILCPVFTKEEIAMERIDSFDSTVPVSVYKMNVNLVNGGDGFVFVDVEAANGVDFRNSDTPYGGHHRGAFS